MGLAVFVMIILILVCLGMIAGVMFYGSQHDSHTAIRCAESSRAVQTLSEQNAAMKSKLAESQEN